LSEFTLCDRVRDDETARRGFLSLAKAVFSLDFTPWLEGGWWGGDYIPHALLDGDKVVANVSVNIIGSSWRGEAKRFIQLGTVMTDPDYRGRGLARRLMEEVTARYRNLCDGMYLYANDSVLDFYPKFGFERAEEWQYRKPVQRSGLPVRKLNMDDEEDRQNLLNAYQKYGNPCSALPVVGNTGLLMFYCAQFLKDCVYEIPSLGCVAVAEFDGDTMLLSDVFGADAPLTEVLSALATEGTKSAALGFTPAHAPGFVCEPRREAGATMFAEGTLIPLLRKNRVMFPLLSHA
jgi:GNAT superfamily N-acetyltransferase